MRRTSLEVVDHELKYVKEVPTHLIRHTPPARLNVARLVFCRNYRPMEAGSCGMGDGCKFVHADVDPETLESHPIHVKYAWRSEELCIYPRLAAGEVLRVTAPNNRPPIEEIASERILVTRGALGEDGAAGPLSHCAHYYFNRMCTRGSDCCFVHVALVDEEQQKDCERFVERCVVTAPRRSGAKPKAKVADGEGAAPKMVPKMVAIEASGSSRSSAGALSSSHSASSRSASCSSAVHCPEPAARVYRHNPYGVNVLGRSTA